MLSTVTWTNPNGGDWSNAANWSTGAVPGPRDDVVLNLPGNPTITHSANVTDTVHSLTNSDNLLLSGGILDMLTLQNTGAVTVDSGATLAAGNYTQTAGITVLQGGTLGSLLPPQNDALSFNGQSFFQVPSSPSLNPTTQVTVEAWVNSTSLSTPLQGIAGDWNDLNGNDRTNMLWVQNQHFAFYVSHDGVDYPSVVSTTTLQTNQWYQVAGTFDGSYLRLYVNGTLEASTYSPGAIDTNNLPFYIGRVDGGGAGPTTFQGQIADVQVWNVARSSSQIQADVEQGPAGAQPGLVGSWSLDNASGTVVDQSGNNNTAQVSGPAPQLSPVVGGTVNIQGGTLTGPGTINGDLVNSGDVSLGSAVGVLAVRGSYTQTSTGTLDLKVGGVEAGVLSDLLSIVGDATLDGTLSLALIPGFNPLAGQEFDVVNSASATGAFATVNDPIADGVSAFTTAVTGVGVDLVSATLPPTSSVDPLPATSAPSFLVSWSGQDNPGGSGVAGFDIFVSDNGGPFVPFQTDTTATSATFTGQRGHTYGFYSVATDRIGNREATPTAAQATTTVPLLVATTTTLVSSAPVSVSSQPVTFTATVAADGSVPTGSVTFLDGTTVLATVVLNAGAASYTSAALGPGTHSIQAVFTPTQNFLASTSAVLTQSVQMFALEADPVNPGELALFVGPGSGDDQVFIDSVDGGKDIKATVREQGWPASSFATVAPTGAIDRIVVFGGSGHDRIVVSNSVKLPVLLFGGSGGNVLRSGAGPSVLVGGMGADMLIGGEGHSILIGAGGHDLLVGGVGGDLLIDGTTVFDTSIMTRTGAIQVPFLRPFGAKSGSGHTA